MQKILRIFVIFLVLSSLLGCSHLPSTYPFVNQDDSIERIELLYHPEPNNIFTTKDYLLIRELASDEIIPFMKAIYNIGTDKCISPPPRGYGEYVSRVIYTNGDVEIFGNYHIEFVKNGDEEAGIGSYLFSPFTAYEELFLSYSGGQAYLDEVWLG